MHTMALCSLLAALAARSCGAEPHPSGLQRPPQQVSGNSERIWLETCRRLFASIPRGKAGFGTPLGCKCDACLTQSSQACQLCHESAVCDKLDVDCGLLSRMKQQSRCMLVSGPRGVNRNAPANQSFEPSANIIQRLCHNKATNCLRLVAAPVTTAVM